MNSLIVMISTGAIAYLIGAIPFGFLIGRLRGVDIRTVGSRNIGATNVFRTLGKGWGSATFVLDLGKGLCGTLWFPLLATHWLGSADAAPPAPELRLLGGVAAVVGHTWPVYLGFRGGKGVATSAGMLLGLAPAAVAVALAAWIVTFAASRFVSLGSVVAAGVMGVAIWLPGLRPQGSIVLPAVLSLLAMLVIVRHRANLQRLWTGTEPRAAFRPRRPEREA